ncbi:hypothetical protein Ahy_B09g099777 [Arachis hypogaea]|uniref:Uncharacterized protein n=1 Tax=Arachis hypogaea TaxID=3818 RepID=A0A444XUS9_ARAHY|nr:hypothetical protein Ahy_B09g099777 [Arachis hypogaea]
MGRGKRNPTGWIAHVSTGQVLFEMDGVNFANARQAATLAAHKPCSSTNGKKPGRDSKELGEGWGVGPSPLHYVSWASPGFGFLITEGASVVPWMATGTNSGNSGSESWLKYLNRSPSGEGTENSEAEPASRNPEARDSDPREEIGPSSVRQ